MAAILGAIFNISKRSMMPEWHQLDSSSTMSAQQESPKKKTLKSSSRSFWFSTGLLGLKLIKLEFENELKFYNLKASPDMNVKLLTWT